MPFALRPQETAFFPAPFVDTEVHMLVITNQRVVQFSDDGKQEMEAREVSFVARTSERPLLLAGMIALLVGLPMLVIGVYLLVTAGPIALPAVPGVPAVPGAPAAPAAAAANPADDPAGPAPGDDDLAAPPPETPKPSNPTSQRAIGVVLALLGFLLAAGGGLAGTRQRHMVLVRGGNKVIKIRAADKMEQTQILSTLSAVQSAGKAAPLPAQAAKAKAPVDDGGDPVKALQDLGAKRASGKISEDEFVAKREVLLERLKSRRS